MLEVHSITKHFPGTTALDDVSLSIRPGEVLALAGENGSGKSTLMKILAGHIRPSEGRLAANGETLKFASPTDSVSARIGFVEQELAVAPHLTVAENILLGRLPRLRFLPGMIDWKAVWRKAQEVMNLLEIDVSPRAIVGQLPLNLQQLISIASVLSRDPRIILLDEATSSLSEDETQHLLRIVRNLRDQGIGIVFISHRMPEMREIADRIVVLRDGRVSGYADMADVSDAEIVRMLVGRDIDDIYPPLSAPTEEMVLQVHGLGTRGFLRDISLSVRSGEIVGLAGLVGSGRSTLVQALFGALPPDTGHIELKGQKVRFRHPRHALAAGVGFVGENRKTQGILRGRSVSENISITALESYARLGLLRPRKEQQDVAESVQKMSIKCHSTSASIEGLSGGNQQKALLARALTNDPRLLILDEPTRGVDVGAKSEIYSQIAAGAAEGRSFLVASSEIPELLGICHRIYVMSQGQIVGCLDGAQATEEHIARLAFHTSEEMEAV